MLANSSLVADKDIGAQDELKSVRQAVHMQDTDPVNINMETQVDREDDAPSYLRNHNPSAHRNYRPHLMC